jgi:hypothetical protein
MVTPPRGEKKVGVFATRSPHRPSRIGLSCVEIEKVEGRKVYIKNFDLLNGSPILDIKPYLTYCDSFPDASLGWLPKKIESFKIVECETFSKQSKWVLQQTGYDLFAFARVQLSEDPFNTKRKRIKLERTGYATLSYRTWRVHFMVSDRLIKLLSISSGYSSDELASTEDRYGDKFIHREYLRIFRGCSL